MSVAVVTDSTAQLPDGLAAEHGIEVVPLTVVVDGEQRLDGVDFDADALRAALKAKSKITTSMATPEAMVTAYEKALAGGADAVVSVHLSSALSGMVDAARTGAEQVSDGPVTVVDSRTTVMGLGFAALAAARVAADGGDAESVVAAAEETAGRTRTVFAVESLEHLRRGGRIGTATALFGTALAMKPLLHISGGKVKPLEKVRTMSRAVGRLVDIAADECGDDPVDLAIHHLGSPEKAAGLADRVRDRVPSIVDVHVSEIGAVLGAHTGPGVLGVVVRRR